MMGFVNLLNHFYAAKQDGSKRKFLEKKKMYLKHCNARDPRKDWSNKRVLKNSHSKMGFVNFLTNPFYTVKQDESKRKFLEKKKIYLKDTREQLKK